MSIEDIAIGDFFKYGNVVKHTYQKLSKSRALRCENRREYSFNRSKVVEAATAPIKSSTIVMSNFAKRFCRNPKINLSKMAIWPS